MNDFLPKRPQADANRPRFVKPGATAPQQPTLPTTNTPQTTASPSPASTEMPSGGITLPDQPTPLAVTPPKKRWGVKKWLLAGVIGLLVATIIGALAAYAWYQQNLRAVEPGSDEMVRVTIKPGTSPEGIASQLKENNLIRNEVAFNWYVRAENKSGLLQAGAYRLGKGEDVPTIVKHLTSGTTDTFDITFLPGATLADHRKVLLDAGYSEADVDAALNKTYDSPLFAGKPATADLEGYIYGETYSFGATATPQEILTYVFDHFYTVVKQEKLEEAYKQRGFNLYQGITLASIIQREVATPEDAAQVSQVFQLRLSRDMPLGSDVTYQYIADKTGQERSVDLDSPYNTRKYPGLPPGPISSPGLASLKAVARPAAGDYLYFLSGDDDKTYFARTNEEHEQNIREHCQKKCQII